ncbi:MAG: hypothetical protein ACK5P6_08360 [Pseudobdellovibrionaceae bacterium]
MATPHISAAAVVIGYYKTRMGLDPSPALVERFLKQGSRPHLPLINFVQEGRTLDLDLLLETVEKEIAPGGQCP